MTPKKNNCNENGFDCDRFDGDLFDGDGFDGDHFNGVQDLFEKKLKQFCTCLSASVCSTTSRHQISSTITEVE